MLNVVIKLENLKNVRCYSEYVIFYEKPHICLVKLRILSINIPIWFK